MPRRSILTERQRAALFDLPTEEASILYYFTLSDEDLEHIDDRRRPENRFGYALQLCALRYPGRLISSREVIPEAVVRFIGAQLGMTGDEILPYAARRQTRQQHLHALRQVYGFKMFSGHRARELKAWLAGEAENATSNHDLACRFADECRQTRTILPGVSVIERLCADALVAAERRIDSAIVARLDESMKARLDDLLSEMVDGKVSRFVWLRQFEVGQNSADATRLLDRLEFLQEMNLSPDILLGMLTVLLAEGLNLGLSKMAEATNTHDYFQLSRLSRWHVESDAINQALAMVIEAQSRLPMASFWGGGVTASSDGQFFPAARQGEAMNLINAKYGSEPGLKAYTHVSDQFGPFATQNIPATVSEAPYILDGLLMNEAGRKITEQYADTGGFTDHVFAVTSVLGFRFIPRIRDLPSRRLHLFDPASAPDKLRGLIGGKIRDGLIVQNWPGVLRSAATMVTGVMPPSQLLKKFAAYPRQHELAVALREIGRVERTLFIIEWLLDADMQRRAQIGLNKGEAHHALKNALRIGRQGEIRDRTAEGQHYRMAGLNLLAAIIIYWNTKHLGQAVAARQRVGLNCAPDLLAHISPLGWAHILLTGEYRWRRRTGPKL